jgi:hypothetical protein
MVRSAAPGESVERFTLTPGELSDLDAAFARAAFDEVDSPGLGAGCADCFTYELTRGDHTIVADDTNLPEELRPVATELDELIGDHTARAADG